MGLFDFLRGKKKMGLADADRKNQAHIAANPEPKNTEDALMRKASSLMTSGQFIESAAVYDQLASEYPERKGLYQSQVGVSYFFRQDYIQAFTWYEIALENGADRSMMDDNMFEAAEIQFKNAGDGSLLEKYMGHFPGGQHIKKARKLSSE